MDEMTRHRFIRRLIGLEVGNLVQATSERLEAAGAQIGGGAAAPADNVIGWGDRNGRAQ